jgi:hypothetical protein
MAAATTTTTMIAASVATPRPEDEVEVELVAGRTAMVSVFLADPPTVSFAHTVTE